MHVSSAKTSSRTLDGADEFARRQRVEHARHDRGRGDASTRLATPRPHTCSDSRSARFRWMPGGLTSASSVASLFDGPGDPRHRGARVRSCDRRLRGTARHRQLGARLVARAIAPRSRKPGGRPGRRMRGSSWSLSRPSDSSVPSPSVDFTDASSASSSRWATPEPCPATSSARFSNRAECLPSHADRRSS